MTWKNALGLILGLILGLLTGLALKQEPSAHSAPDVSRVSETHESAADVGDPPLPAISPAMNAPPHAPRTLEEELGKFDLENPGDPSVREITDSYPLYLLNKQSKWKTRSFSDQLSSRLNTLDEEELPKVLEEHKPSFDLLSLSPLETVIEIQGQDEMMLLRLQIQLAPESMFLSKLENCLKVSSSISRAATDIPHDLDRSSIVSCPRRTRGGRLWIPLHLAPLFYDHGAGLGALIEVPDERGSGLVELVFDERARQTQTHRASWQMTKASTE